MDSCESSERIEQLGKLIKQTRDLLGAVKSAQLKLPSIVINEKKIYFWQVLIFANKQHLPNAMSYSEVAEKLEISNLGTNCAVLPTSTEMEGSIERGLDWIMKYGQKYDTSAWVSKCNIL